MNLAMIALGAWLVVVPPSPTEEAAPKRVEKKWEVKDL
jgi:hypothetical protein